MKLISWNVNGLRACAEKGFYDFVRAEEPDILGLQETKLQPGQIELPFDDRFIFWNSAEKKGYSGTALIAKEEPLSVYVGLGEEGDPEGRVITARYPHFYFVTVYSPNSQRELARLPFRMQWEDALLEHLMRLDRDLPVILCGDLNVAHEEIDLKHPKTNRGNAGFTDEERAKFSRLLESGFADSFRRLNPDATGAYSWWSYIRNARATNAGWRIDYFVVSERLVPHIRETIIYKDVYGSDHCPVGLVLDFEE